MTPGRKKSAAIAASVFLAAVFAAWLGGFIRFAVMINSFPPDDGRHIEAAVALTGGRNRITEAVRLLNEGKADRVFISGVEKGITVNDIVKLLDISVKYPSRIELGHAATNTEENAAEVKDWVQKNNIHSMRLVTSNYHILRSLAEMKAHGVAADITVTPVYSERVAPGWWKAPGTFRLIFAEYNKYLAVLLENLFR